MSSLVNSSILIPALPLFSALLIGSLLLSFNRTMNRLTKPVSFLIINSALFSALFALFFVYKHVSGEFIFSPLRFLNIDYKMHLILNNYSEISVAIIGIIAVITMFISYNRTPRSKGYVAYLVSFSSVLGLLFFFLLSDIFLDMLPFPS